MHSCVRCTETRTHPDEAYLNNIVEQDHRAIKRLIKPMMGFKDSRCARIILPGIEVIHMIRKGR